MTPLLLFRLYRLLPMASARRRGWSAPLLAALLMSLLVLLPGPAQAQAPCAPAYAPSTGNGSGTTFAFVTQQSFTATCTGKLTTFVMRPGVYSDDLRGTGYFVTASIKDATGTTLATLPRTDQYYPGPYTTTVTFDFSSANVVLTAGTQYRWELAASYNAPNTAQQLILGATDSGNPYAGGDYIADGAVQTGKDIRGWTINLAAAVQTGTISGSPFCAGSAVSVPFTTYGTIGSGNIYTAQLSNASGSFAAPVSIGTLSSTAASGTISAIMPAGTTAGNGYRIQVVASTAGFSPIFNTGNLTINNTAAPTGAASQSFSSGATVANLAATGTAIQWYAASTGGSPLASTTPLVNGTTYYATQTVSGCESLTRLAVTATVAASAPTVTTTAPASITSTGATLGGNATSDGGATVTERGVVYSTSSTTPTTADTKAANGTGTGSFSQAVTGLTAGTLYYVRAYALNSVGTSYGVVQQFTTTAAVPTLTSASPGSGAVGSTIALNGSGLKPTMAIVFAGTVNNVVSSGYTVNAAGTQITGIVVPSGAITGNVQVAYLTGIPPMQFPAGSNGVPFTVTASATAPTVTTTAPASIGTASATLGGNATADGGATVTERGVVYSTSNNTPTVADTKVQIGAGTGSFSQAVTGLTAGTLYYVRAYALNSVGTSYGVVQSFTTTAAPTALTVSTGTPASPTSIPAGSYTSITVTGTGNAILSGAVSVSTGLTVQSGGSLSTNCQTLMGAGSFTLAAGATLAICDDNGITASGSTGAVQVSGTRSFSTDASYLYNGNAGVQSTGNGLPATVRNLTAANDNNNVSLSQPVSIRQMLTVSGKGDLVLNGQALTLLSDASGTALAVNSSGGAVTGMATVQRYIDGSLNPGAGYRHYSAPVTNTTVSDLATSGFTPVLTQSYNTSATPGTTTPFPNVFGYDQSRLATVMNNYSAFDKGFFVPQSTDALTPGRGYAVNIGAGQLVDFVGTLGTGDQTLNLARNSGPTAADAGWQLVGNPYPAPLDWSQVSAGDRSNLDAAIYVVQSTGQYAGGYRAYVNGQSTTGTNNPLLATAQGFFVRVSPGQTTGSLTFRNAQRVTDYTTAQGTTFQRLTADSRPVLRLTLAGAGLADSWVAYAEAGATPGFDTEYDAAKLPNGHGLNLSSAGSSPLAIDGRPAFTLVTVVPLAVGVPAAGSYALTASAIDNLSAGLTAYLHDAQTGTTLALTAGTSYAFSMSSAQALLPGRFTVQFAPAAPLAATPAALAASVSVYPNPARAQATVAVPGLAGTAAVRVELLNALGQVVLRQQAALPASGTQLVLPTAGLPTGIYFVRLTAGELLVTKRLTLE